MRTVLLAMTALACPGSLPAKADIKVGVIVGATGPSAALGISYKNTVAILPTTIGGEKVQYIILDDATDPTTAVRNARKLISEDNVDVIMGSSSAPTATAIADVATELKTPDISYSPLPPAEMKSPWVYTIPQPATLMMAAVVDHMKSKGVRSIGYIGFNDAWGDLVYAGTIKAAEQDGIKVLTNERYARPDTSVVGQVLKIMVANPDVVVSGGSGVPGALPQTTLVDRGYKGAIYHSTAVVMRDFIRVGGKDVEGAIAPTGPVIVAEQLPDSNPIKKVALDFTKAYEAKFGAGPRNAFAAYSYDAYLLFANAVPGALKIAKPGTQEFRQAIRDTIEKAGEVVGTHAVYNMTPTDHSGVDKRSVVLVRVEKGEWKLLN